MLPSRRPPPPVLHSLSCCPLPAPQVPVGPCIPVPRARFFRLVPRPAAPLSLPLTSLSPLSTPVGYPFLVTSFLCQFLNHSPPAGLYRRPGPFQSQDGSCLHYWKPSLLRRYYSSPYLMTPCLLMLSGSCCICLGALLRVFERPGRLHSLEISHPRHHTRATRL